MLAGLDKPQCPMGAVKTADANWGGLPLQALLKLSRGIDAFTRWTGKRLAWLILVAVVISAVHQALRQTLYVSSYFWLLLHFGVFLAIFLLFSTHTFLDNAHH